MVCVRSLRRLQPLDGLAQAALNLFLPFR
jgi:hypothetical protein